MVTKNRLLATLLSLAMIVTFMPVMSFAGVEAQDNDVEYWYDDDRDVLPGWWGNIEDYVDGEVNGEYFRGEVTKTEVIEGADLINWDADNLEFRVKDLEENPFGRAVIKVYFNDHDGSTNFYNCEINIGKDVYEIFKLDGFEGQRGLPGQTLNLSANAKHEYIDDDNEYRQDLDGLTFSWEITNGEDYAVLTPDATDPLRASLRFKTVDELGKLMHEDLDEEVEVRLTMKSGNTEVADEDGDFWICDGFTELYPNMLDNPELGETITFEPEVLCYDLNGTAEDGFTDNCKSVEIDDDDIDLEYDDEILEITESNGVYTLKRLKPLGTDLRIRVQFGDEERERSYWFDEFNYNIWSEEHDIDVFSDADPVPAAVFNMEDFGDDPTSKFDIEYTVGTWEDSDDEGTWGKTLTDKEYSVEYKDKKAYVTLSPSVVSAVTDDEHYRIQAMVFLKGTQDSLADTDCWIHIREARVNYNLLRDTDVLPDWEHRIDKNFSVYVQNTQYPDGEERELEISDVKITAQAGEDVISLNKFEDYWICRAEGFGTATLQLTYKDIDGKTATHDLHITVKDMIYWVDLENVDGIWQGLPGTSINLTAGGTKAFVVEDTEKSRNYRHVETTEGLTYEWSLAEGSEYASITVDPSDSGKAVLKFKDIPAGGEFKGGRVLLNVSVNDGATQNCASREEDYYVEDEFYRIYPTTIDGTIDIGESITFTPEVRYYKFGKDGYDVVKNADIGAEDIDSEVIQVTENNGTFTVKRLKEWGSGFSLSACFENMYGEEDWIDQWYNLTEKNYSLGFDKDEYYIYPDRDRTIYLQKSEDLKAYTGDYEVELEVGGHLAGKGDDGWESITADSGAYTFNEASGKIIISGSKLSNKYDYASLRVTLTIGGESFDEDWSWCGLNPVDESEMLDAVKTDAKDELDSLFDAKNEADYDAAEWADLKKAVEAGKAAIDKSTTTSDVESELKTAKDTINKIKTKAQKAAEAAAAEKAKAEAEAAKKAKAAAAAAEAKAKATTTVTVNSKTVNASTIAAAIKAAGGKTQYVKSFVIDKKVKKISANAFKGTNITTLTIKSKKLKKKSVKKALKGSKVKTVKVKVGNKKTNKKYVKKYKKIFTKKNAGKKVKVK